MAHGDRWTCGQWGGASNRRVAGSTMGNRPATTRGLGAEGGDWGKSTPTGGPSLPATAPMGNGRQAGSRVKMGWVRCRAGPTVEKTAQNNFSILNHFLIE
jgi:hypothetical protein